MNQKSLVAKVRAALAADPSLTMCSFSHITSIPAVVLPVKELSAACHDAGAIVVIDVRSLSFVGSRNIVPSFLRSLKSIISLLIHRLCFALVLLSPSLSLSLSLSH